jgi:SAM-dependent methyltransferase
LEEARNHRAAVLRAFGPHIEGRVLEVGAGIGHFTKLLLESSSVRELVSVEPNNDFCARLRATFPRHAVFRGTSQDLEGPEDWDTIVSVNVLEHIADDCGELATYARLLKLKKGTLCLFVPARPEIYAPLDRDFGHFRRYTRPELRRKLEQATFEVQQLYYFNVVGYFAWWLNFCLLRKRRFNARSVSIFDRLIFPVVFALESRGLHPPIGQSLLAVARAA